MTAIVLITAMLTGQAPRQSAEPESSEASDLSEAREAIELAREEIAKYAIARFNSHVALKVSYDDRDVWEVPRLRGGIIKNPESTYFAFQSRIPKISGQKSE